MHYLSQLFKLLLKFASASAVATLVDVGVYYAILKLDLLEPEYAVVVSRSVGMVINFVLQKKYVFDLKRGLYQTFAFALLISIGGIGLGWLIIKFLTDIDVSVFFADGTWLGELVEKHQNSIARVIEIGIIFFYNFVLKRFAFERRFFSFDDKPPK